MKKSFLSCFIVFILAVISLPVFGEKIQLQWDAVPDVDGYRLFQTTKTQDFDFDNPIKTSDFPSGDIPQNVTAITIDLPGVSNSDLEYIFTARAFVGENESENSNEVSYIVSMIPPPPPMKLAGSYSKKNGVVKISWQQTPDEYEWRTISHWIIYYRIGESQWQAIGRINSDHELEMTAPLDAVSDGQRASVDFLIVSYRRSGVYSANSEILTLDIDRREVPQIQNLRINIEIPVN